MSEQETQGQDQQDDFADGFAEETRDELDDADQGTDDGIASEQDVATATDEDDIAPATGGDAGQSNDDPNSQTWEQRYKTLQGKYNAEIARSNFDKPQQSHDTGHEDDSSGHDDDGDELEKALDEDHPTLSKGMERKAGRMAREAEERIRRDMAPVFEAAQETLVQKHFSEIRATHSDFNEITSGNNLMDWVKSQPSFARDRYEAVMARGSADAVIEMLSAYKQARGIKQTKHTGNDDLVVHTRSRPSIPRGEPDKSDFAAGFNS